jgi:serine/threonine protein kinase
VRPLSEGAGRDFAWGLERFRDEAKLLIGFRHTNIVPVLAYFEANGTGYLVMAFQDGTSLAEILRGTPTLSEAQVLQFLVPLLDGVEEVHRHNFLHRDIKPENIFIRSDGTPVLLDFGAARQALGEHSKSLTTLLTEGYAPFEQYAGTGNQGPWSDIYALAAVAFRCLAGKPPVEAPRRAVARLRGVADPMAADFAALRTAISSDFAFAIEAAMRVVEQERPQSVAAFRDLMISPVPATARLPAIPTTPASAVTLIPDAAQRVTVRHPPPSHVAERKAPRRTVRFAVFGAIVLAVASGGAYIGDQRNWLPDAFRRVGPESAHAPARASPAAPGSGQARRQADDTRRKADEAVQRAALERRRAEQRAIEEQRNKALAEYQRLQLDQIEAERRQFLEARKTQTEQRKPDDDDAAPDSGSGSSDRRARTDAERKHLDEEPAPRAPPQLAPKPPPRPSADEERGREFDSWPPAMPPTARRPQSLPPGDTQRYGPYAPPARGQPPRGRSDPGADDDDY